MRCPLRKDGVHDMTKSMRCACGHEWRIPPVCFSVDVLDGNRQLVSDGFNCDSVSTVAERLREIADELERL